MKQLIFYFFITWTLLDLILDVRCCDMPKGHKLTKSNQVYATDFSHFYGIYYLLQHLFYWFIFIYKGNVSIFFYKMRMSQRGLQILSKPSDQRTADDIRYVSLFSLIGNSHIIIDFRKKNSKPHVKAYLIKV